MIRKVHEAKENSSKTIEVWGTGKPLREFLYVDDLAEMSTYCLESVDAADIYKQGISHLNCGSEDETTILELTNIIQDVVGYTGDIVFDSSKPDGTYAKNEQQSNDQHWMFTKTYIKRRIKKNI